MIIQQDLYVNVYKNVTDINRSDFVLYGRSSLFLNKNQIESNKQSIKLFYFWIRIIQIKFDL
jgi:hypothetical protein